MTTITEILAEAFNRVKAEHGINLSSVDFEHYSGTLSGVTFKAVGNVQSVYSYPAFPPQAPAPIPWPQPHQMPQPPIVHQVDPNDCTHVGSVDVYDDCYWKFEADRLYLWDGSGIWKLYDDGESAQRTVDSQLRAVANPT